MKLSPTMINDCVAAIQKVTTWFEGFEASGKEVPHWAIDKLNDLGQELQEQKVYDEIPSE